MALFAPGWWTNTEKTLSSSICIRCICREPKAKLSTLRCDKAMVSFLAYVLLAFVTHPSFAFVVPAFTRPSTFVAVNKQSVSLAMSDSSRYSNPNQEERFATAKKENNQRHLDITTVYDPSYLKGKRVAITGANRGIGLALAKEVTDAGAQLVALCRSSSDELEALKPAELITGMDVQSDEKCSGLADQIKGGPIDIVSAETEEDRSLWWCSCPCAVLMFLSHASLISRFRRLQSVARQQCRLLYGRSRKAIEPQLSGTTQDN
jgi:hypothetical protein